ncbi:anti-phage deoxyguanosine triphosphatase [Neptunicella sp. SCSIO 80796]|uniref:anti-phage deoxyguanosine triphosphatase n=1 Tax=Neptunicella plasticusilytica TaxID=3117012 RepID=UPI003A4D2BE3
MMSPVWTERCFENNPNRENDHRSPYQRDKARVLHSAAFRRLQSKTQVLGVGLNDFHRTRLTHSLEAAQIGQGIVAQLQQKHPELTHKLELDNNLIETICLAHDIGHPAFGHGGEIALHYMMREHGGFEGNGQTFRIISKLEPYTLAHGMNLSRRTVLGLVKYPSTMSHLGYQNQSGEPASFRQLKASQWHPPKGLYDDDQDILDWLLAPLDKQDRELFCSLQNNPAGKRKTRFKSFDCSIMELADDIAYGIHDLEDAITMGIVKRDDFVTGVADKLADLGDGWFTQNISELTDKLFSHHHYQRKDAIGALVNKLITSISIQATHDDFQLPLLKYNAALDDCHHQALSAFKDFVFKHVIRKADIQRLEYKGQQVIMELFEAFSSDPQRLLPENTSERWLTASEKNKGHRVICDYISGMTDGYAARIHRNLFVPDIGGAFI